MEELINIEASVFLNVLKIFLLLSPVISFVFMLISKRKSWAITRELKYLTYNYLHLFTIILISEFFSFYDFFKTIDSLLSNYRFLAIERTVFVAVICFFAVDFLYYIRHRLEHAIPVLWYFHSKHHSGEFFNSTLFARVSPFTLIYSWIFLVPLILIGFPFEYIYYCYVLPFLLQFFIHLDCDFGPKILQSVFNCPSLHKIHHYANHTHSNCNYAGILTIWDRIFKTQNNQKLKPEKFGLIKK
jgi:sterol desaturase/sphingolipid hydroxylase (fatty acid hydroxylase superfamily)